MVFHSCSWFFQRTGFQRTGNPSIFIDGHPSLIFIDGYPSMNSLMDTINEFMDGPSMNMVPFLWAPFFGLFFGPLSLGLSFGPQQVPSLCCCWYDRNPGNSPTPVSPPPPAEPDVLPGGSARRRLFLVGVLRAVGSMPGLCLCVSAFFHAFFFCMLFLTVHTSP